jgi:UDP-GlcNAc:undecaprenyl-phosphate GlcNAc-1-phosphate transferase
LIVLAIPIYETVLVTYFRIKKGRSPFKGSKDHYALRMEQMGFSRYMILLVTLGISLALSGIAYVITRVQNMHALILFGSVAVLFTFAARWLGKVEVT